MNTTTVKIENTSPAPGYYKWDSAMAIIHSRGKGYSDFSKKTKNYY
jgi:hypothetical protein